MDSWINTIYQLKNDRIPFVMVTVVDSQGGTPREIGAKMIISDQKLLSGTIGGGHLEKLAITDAQKCLENNQSQTIDYPLSAKTGQCCGGKVTLLFEPFGSKIKFCLFGAGHVGQAVCDVLEETPFEVHVIDNRDEWIQHPQLSSKTIRHHIHWEHFIYDFKWDNSCFAVIMTHDHAEDESILSHLLKKDLAYLGLIGSTSKWRRFTQRLLAKGFSHSQLDKVHCPIGEAVVGKSPKEVAISLAYQVLKIVHQENNGTKE